MDGPVATATDASPAASHRLVDRDITTAYVHCEPLRVIATDSCTRSPARLSIGGTESGVEEPLVLDRPVERRDVDRPPGVLPRGFEEPDEAGGRLDFLAGVGIPELPRVKVA